MSYLNHAPLLESEATLEQEGHLGNCICSRRVALSGWCVSQITVEFPSSLLSLINTIISAPSLQSFFGFGQSAEIEIELANSATRKQVDVKNEDGKKEKLFLYYDGETVSGKVRALLLLLFTNSVS